MSRPVRALWIEIFSQFLDAGKWRSRPVRALWIEISKLIARFCADWVEAREGLVD